MANLGLFQYPLKFLLLFAIQQESQSKPRRNWFPNDNKVYPAPGRKAVQVWDFFLELIFLLQYFQSGWVHVCAVLNCKHCSMYLSTLCLKQRQCNCNALVLIGCTHWLAAFLSLFYPLSLTVASEQSPSLVMFFVEFHCGQFQCLCFLFACFILVTKKASSPHEGTCIIHAKLHQGEGGVRTVVVSIRIGSQSENGHLQAPSTPLANILTPP